MHTHHTWLILLGLTILCAGTLAACGDAPRIATLRTPDAAVQQALSRDGWLFHVIDLQIHTHESLPAGEVFLISGTLGPERDSQPTIGLVDAKRNWRGWYAHGWRALGRDLLDDSQPLQASLLLYESSRVIAGRADTAEVEIICDAGTTHARPTADDFFLAVVGESPEPCEVRALDAAGTEITRVLVENPQP